MLELAIKFNTCKKKSMLTTKPAFVIRMDIGSVANRRLDIMFCS
jgi:hypothetical protein